MDNIGSYRVISSLGAGAFGVVYEAYQPFLDRHVAIKTLRDVLVNDPKLEQSFMAEARTIARLRHPNIVTIYEFGTTLLNNQSTTYLVMEYLPGKSLSKRIKEKSLTLPQILDILREIASALDFAHANNIVHCDLKPANIIFTEAGQPVIVDFGLAKLIEISAVPAELGSELDSTPSGTPAYSSPEQLSGQRPSEASDIYALATIAFEMLSGQLPYPESHSNVRQPRTAAPPLLSAVTRHYGTRADSVLARALSLDPAERFATAVDFARALGYALMPNRSETRVITIPDPQQAAALNYARQSVRGFTWGIVTLVVVFSLFCIGLFVRAYVEAQPNMLSDGLNTLPVRDNDGYRIITSVWPGSSAEKAGIRINDRIRMTIDDDRRLADLDFTVNGLPRWIYGINWQPQLDDEIVQEVRRDGVSVRMTYRLERATHFLILLFSMLLPALVSFAGAVTILVRYGDDQNGLFFSLILLELTVTAVATGVVPAVPGLYHVTFYLFFAMAMQFVLTFPTQWPVLQRIPWLRWVLYLPVILGLVQFLSGQAIRIGDLDFNMILYAGYGVALLTVQVAKWIRRDMRHYPELWITLSGHLFLALMGGVSIYLNIARSSPGRIVDNSSHLLIGLFVTLGVGVAVFAITQVVGFLFIQKRIGASGKAPW